MIAGIHIVGGGRPQHTKRWYIYASRGGPRIGIRIGGPKPTSLTPNEVRAYSDLVAQSAAKPAHTVAALVRDYRASPEWSALEKTTKRQWSRHLGLIEERWGDTRLSIMSDRRMKKWIIAWRDERAHTPRTADYGVGVLRHLLQWGYERGRVEANVAQGIPALYRGGNRATILWSAEDVESFVKGSPQHIGDIVRLASVTGLRASDLAGLKWSDVGEHAIVRETGKKNRGKIRNAVIPLLGTTRVLLDELRNRYRAENVETVLVNSFGKSWSETGVSSTVSARIKLLDIRDRHGKTKHLHDLRGTFATALFTNGLSDEEAAEILAWSPTQVKSIRHHYVDRTERLVAVAKRLNGAVVKPVVKPDGHDQPN